MIIIGIDTGAKTGFAVNHDGDITQLATHGIIKAMEAVLRVRSQFADDLVICIEDTRQRKWSGKMSKYDFLAIAVFIGLVLAIVIKVVF